ncbi:MAG: gamma-glutamyltransferase [Rhodoferax sp.]|nr:gamma-glutamyltransferase [Rhodoferax sp.]
MDTRPSLFRLTTTRVAILLACSTVVAGAHADRGKAAPGVQSSVNLPEQSQGKPPAWAGKAFRQGVVSAANPYAAEAGAKILEQGGNAVDAAVAVAYALNVVEPQSAGIGGGGFMMIHMAKTGQTVIIDSREEAPAGATPSMFVGQPFSRRSLQGVAVGIPGMVRGTEMAVNSYGKLSLSQVLQPAIALADGGFAATPRFVSSTACSSATSRAKNSPAAADYFCPGGDFRAVGSLVTNQPLAQTFRQIATHGADCFYRYMPEKGCDIALGIIEGQQYNQPHLSPIGKGGSMTLDDLAQYQAKLRTPIEGSYRGHRIKSMPPPSSGALTVLQILKLVERFPLGDASQGYGFGTVKTANVMADAMRLAFADRAIWMGDADFAPVPAKGLLANDYVAMRSQLITPGARLDPNPAADDPRPYEVAGLSPATRLAVAAPPVSHENGTTHFSVVDKWGNVVSYTNTIESGYGIGVFAGYQRPDGSFKNHGFLLNNELTDFNTSPTINPFTGTAGFNDVEPGKRPRSSMAPSMIFNPDGSPLMAYGSPGGATIINSVVNVTINLIDHGMTMQEAVDAPRLSVSSANPSITVDPWFPAATVTALGPLGLGYAVNLSDVGSVQTVLIEPKTGKQYGAADARREGTVIGLPRSGGR